MNERACRLLPRHEDAGMTLEVGIHISKPYSAAPLSS
jgi:hypothetical protein